MDISKQIEAIEEYMDASLCVNGKAEARAKEAIKELKEKVPDKEFMVELDKITDMLRMEYIKAVNMEFINRPMAYALYKTWEKYNRSLENKRGGEDDESD